MSNNNDNDDWVEKYFTAEFDDKSKVDSDGDGVPDEIFEEDLVLSEGKTFVSPEIVEPVLPETGYAPMVGNNPNASQSERFEDNGFAGGYVLKPLPEYGYVQRPNGSVAGVAKEYKTGSNDNWATRPAQVPEPSENKWELFGFPWWILLLLAGIGGSLLMLTGWMFAGAFRSPGDILNFWL